MSGSSDGRRVRAERGRELEALFDLSLAQALDEVGPLILTRDAAVFAVGETDRTQMCGIGLDHGIWFFSDLDGNKAAGSPNWQLMR